LARSIESVDIITVPLWLVWLS